MDIQAQAEPSRSSSIVDKYLSSPQEIKNRVRTAIGARNDDEAVKLLNTDQKAIQAASSLLKSQEPESLLTSPQAAPLEDVLYPRGK